MDKKRITAVEIGRKGGTATKQRNDADYYKKLSELALAARRASGKMGGRPRKPRPESEGQNETI